MLIHPTNCIKHDAAFYDGFSWSLTVCSSSYFACTCTHLVDFIINITSLKRQMRGSGFSIQHLVSETHPLCQTKQMQEEKMLSSSSCLYLLFLSPSLSPSLSLLHSARYTYPFELSVGLLMTARLSAVIMG